MQEKEHIMSAELKNREDDLAYLMAPNLEEDVPAPVYTKDTKLDHKVLEKQLKKVEKDIRKKYAEFASP